jgi:hypothetical protein
MSLAKNSYSKRLQYVHENVISRKTAQKLIRRHKALKNIRKRKSNKRVSFIDTGNAEKKLSNIVKKPYLFFKNKY